MSWRSAPRFLTSRNRHVQESTSYRTPALKVAGKLIARLRTEAEGGASRHSLRLEQVDRRQLAELLHEAWLLHAPATLRQEHLGPSTH
jgi:hypothetical protein